jgi:osmotically-inducible protein OsmY
MRVKAVANDLEARLPTSVKRSDTDLAMALVHALEWDVRVPANQVKATVKDGWVTLDGEVEWNFERVETGKAVRRLKGVMASRTS